MAKFRIRVDKRTGVTYFPKEICQEGFAVEFWQMTAPLTNALPCF